MGQAHRPAGLFDQLIGQVRRAAASLQRRLHRRAGGDSRRNPPPVVIDLRVLHDLTRFVQDANLHEILVIIQAHKQPSRVYNRHVRCSG